MKSIIEKTIVVLLIACVASGAWATECLFSNVDKDTTNATTQDGKYGTNFITFKLNNPTDSAVKTTTFPSSGTALITQINLCARSDDGKKNATKVKLMGSTSGRVFTGTVTYLGASTFTITIGSNSWNRKNIQILFDEGAIPVDVTETYTLRFCNNNWDNVEEGYSVVSAGSWKPAMRIYGATLTSTPEATLASTPITIESSGQSLGSSASLISFSAFMRVSNLPESSGRIFAWLDSSNHEMYLAKTSTGFKQGWLNNGTDAGGSWGASDWTYDAGDHWIAVTYDCAIKDTSDGDVPLTYGPKGSYSYVDGVQVAAADALRFRDRTLPKLTIGGASLNNDDVATGMVIHEAYQCSDTLTAAQVATVTAALQKGWSLNSNGTVLNGTSKAIPDGDATATGSIIVAKDGTYTFVAGTTLTGTNMKLPDSDSRITGTIVFAADGSYAFSGEIAVCSGTVTVPSGTTITSVAEGATAQVTTSTAPANLNAALTGGYAIAGSLTVPESVDGTITLVDASGTTAIDASSTWSEGVCSFSGTAPANPAYTGSQWWWDYEFNGTAISIGSDTGAMTLEGNGEYYTDADANGNKELYFQKTPYRGASFSSKSELTAVMYCQPGAYANSVLVGFGSTTASGQKAIALVTGANPAAGEMKLVLTDALAANVEDKVKTLANLTAVDATTKKHLYAFVMDRIENNTKTRIRVYMDGKVKAIYKHNTTLALSDGFQIGSFHGGVAPTGFNTGFLKYSASGNSGTLDFLRIKDSSLSDDAMAALADRYPYNSANGEATRAAVSSEANWVEEEPVWTQEVPGEASAAQTAPNTRTNVKLTVGGSSVVPVALNLASDSNYESLTFEKAAGATGSLKLTSTSGNATTGKLVAGETAVRVNTTIPAGRVSLGNASIADGVTLTVDPYSADNQAILRNLATLGFGETYEEVIISMAILGQGASAVLGDQTALNDLGFTATLTYTESNQSYTLRITREAASSAGNITVTADAEGNVTWLESKGVVLPQPAALPAGYTGTVTVAAGAYNGMIIIPTSFNGGTLIVSSGSVDFTGTATVSYAVAGTLNLSSPVKATAIQFTGSGTVACAAADTLKGTIKGDSTVTITYPTHTLPVEDAAWTDDDWEGTLVITNCGHLAVVPADDPVRVPFENYGSAYSSIKAPGFKGYAAQAANLGIPYCKATLIVDSGHTFELNHGDDAIIGNKTEAGFKFKKLTGSGKILLDGESDIAQYIFEDVSTFSGEVEITDPNPDRDEGGKKSFIFNLPAEWEVSTAFPANLVIADGEVTVPDGKTWDIPAGVVLNGDSVLKLGSGSTITRLNSKSDRTSTLSVPTGTATLTNVMDSVVKTKLSIGSSAKLAISDTSLTTLTIPADSTKVDPEDENSKERTYSNAGTLDLSGCSALKELYLDLGEAKTFDFSKVTLPGTCGDVYYNIGDKRNLTDYSLAATGSWSLASVTNICYYAVETAEEYANGGFVVSNVANNAVVWLIRQNGALIKTAVSNGTDRVYAGGSSFAGAACWHEWDFEKEALADRLKDWGACTTNDSVVTEITLSTVESVTSANYSTCRIDVQNEDKIVLSSAVHPYASLALSAPWSMALRCSMPTVTGDGKAVAIAFGDTSSGILGLASAANDYVELFNWMPTEGGTYTTLARFKVEQPSEKDNMHIYVFTVTNENDKNYVSLYRDGEFIHTAEFVLNSAITKFMVGDVSYTGGRPSTLPVAASDNNATTEVNEAGYVDYVRLYDKVLPEADITGLSARRPFVSAIDLYERGDIDPLGAAWYAEGAWTLKPGNNGPQTTAAAPTNAANAVVSIDASTTLDLNIDEDVTFGTLIFGGNGRVGLGHAGTESGRIGAEMFVVRKGVELTVDYDAINLTNTVVGVDQGASLTFSFDLPLFETVTTTTNFFVTGVVPARAYDDSVDDRIQVTGAPASGIWALSVAPVDIDPSEDDAAYRYQVTITPNHQAGADVYYKSGALSAGMTVYTDSELNTETALFLGDKVVVAGGASVAAGVEADFACDIKVTSNTTLTLTPEAANVLDGRVVTVESGSTLNLGGGTYGALTLNGSGTIVFADDATVARIVGSATISVADGKALTLGSLGMVSGGVSGSGTVVLPTLGTINRNSVNVIRFNQYGNENSTVRVVSIGGGWLQDEYIKPTIDIQTQLVLDDFSAGKTNTFAKITGNGNISLSCNAASVNVSGTWYSTYYAYFLVKDISEFGGSLTVSNVGVAIGDTKPVYTTPGGKIIVDSGKSASVAAGKTWTGSAIKVDGNLAVAKGGTLSGTITGGGTITCDSENTNVAPSAMTIDANDWTGTVWIKNFADLTGKNYTSGSAASAETFVLNNYGNALSTIRLTNVKGYLSASTDGTYTLQPALELVNEGANPGLTLYNGWGYNNNAEYYTIVRKLKGSGTLVADTTLTNDGRILGANVLLWIRDWGDFTGTITLPNKNILFAADEDLPSQTVVDGGGNIFIRAGNSVTIPDGKTWTCATCYVDGTVITGSGMLSGEIVGNGASATTEGSGSEAVITVVPLDSEASSEVAVKVPASYAGKVVIPVNVSALKITGAEVASEDIGLRIVRDGRATTYYGILSIGEGGAVALDGTKEVDGIKVAPEIKTGDAENPPMAMGASTPSFKVKTIPGLYYAVKAASSIGDLAGNYKYGEPVQATGSSIDSLEAPTFPGTVIYYKIDAGLSGDDLTKYIISQRRLANTPTEDGIFTYGETGWNHDVYRIPAMAATPDGQTVMGIFDARYNYQDLGVPLTDAGNNGGEAAYSNPDHYTGIDIGGVFSLDGGENWSYPQVMIDVPNASNPTNIVAQTTALTAAMELGDPCIVYDPSGDGKFVMMGITGGGLSTVGDGKVDVVTYECSLASVQAGAPAWTNRTSVKSAIETALQTAGDFTIPVYKTTLYGNGYLGILQGPGHAFVTRYDCPKTGTVKIPAGTVVWPMQYVVRESGNLKGGDFAAWYSGGAWHTTTVVPNDDTKSYVTQEGCITQLDDGSLLYMCKKLGGGSRPFYKSTDGVNWTFLNEITITGSEAHQGSILRLGAGSDGHSRYAAVFATGTLRSDIKAFIGTDTGSGGVDWDEENPIMVWAGATGTADDDGNGAHGNLVYGYNSLVMLDSTTLGVLFEAHGHIYFTKIDVSSALK